ncbi:FliM/FliN family flagellar motor switch protein [Morganella morganii subsp. sibonii]|uniref:FliM/FliN family flagellar motor switch protein n=1 Tax=Morganella morganii TaxID=582 RepID=UPI0030D2AA1F
MNGRFSSPVVILSEQDLAAIRLKQRYRTRYSSGSGDAEIRYQTHTTSLTLAVTRRGQSGSVYCSYDDLAVLLQPQLSGTDIRLLPEDILTTLITAWLDSHSAEFHLRGIIQEDKTVTGITVIFNNAIFVFSDISLIHSHLELMNTPTAKIPLKIRICSADFYLPRCEILRLNTDDLIISPFPDDHIPVSVYYRHTFAATGTLHSNKVTIRKMTLHSRRKTALSSLKSVIRFELAETEITLDELAALKPDSLITLTGQSEHYIRVFCDDDYIADGILVSFQQRLAVQIKTLTGIPENSDTGS